MSRILYLSDNPNGETEIINITLSPSCKARNKQFDFNFADIVVKGRSAQGNIITKYPIKKIRLKQQGGLIEGQ